jgi:hypothetical protein
MQSAGISNRSTSVDVRRFLTEALQLDLVGPYNDHPFANELLPETPLRWYMTGFLVPTSAPITQKFDETSLEEIDSAADSRGLDDNVAPDKASAKRNYMPSSLGLSVLVPASSRKLRVTVEWGEYLYEGPGDETEPESEPRDVVSLDSETAEIAAEADMVAEPYSALGQKQRFPCWRRSPITRTFEAPLPGAGSKPPFVPVPNSGGLMLMVTVRDAQSAGMPAGTMAVSAFLVNARKADEVYAYRSFIFQVRLTLQCEEGFVPRPDPRDWSVQDEWDQRVNDLHYANSFEFAVGHGVSARAVNAEGNRCSTVQTTWIPEAEVERVAPQKESNLPGLAIGMEELGQLKNGAEARSKLEQLVVHYKTWIAGQRTKIGHLNANRKATATDMLVDAETAAARIQAGIDLLADDSRPEILDAFRIANRVMARSARRRQWISAGKARTPAAMDAPKWRPFQLAYLLMTLRGIVEPAHPDREEVDLLFFPTGGGKTEAYFGLAAFTIVLRRLRNPGIRSAGMTVLMRYTLRLLTLDQLGRASALMCALELERHQLTDGRLGKWPFEIGLWVGQAATPNRMGGKGQPDPECVTAYCKTMRFAKNGKSNPAPIPVEECPWCGTKFTRDSFRLEPNLNRPLNLKVHCVNENCDFCGDNALPILAVDEPIYRRLPCFLIATVDKFAALPWTGQTGCLFGKVERFDDHGFYGPCDVGGQPIPGGQLLPPDLIIQDELHLISGSLGTIAGLYETAIDALCIRKVNEISIRPKIIASTATVRRADRQIRALFGRSSIRIFPPPGPDRRDSFFAQTESPAQSPARLYLGIAAQGRSLKVVLLRVARALLSAGFYAWSKAGGVSTNPNPADPYCTFLGYFNSLRELGGSRRILEDEVRTQVAEYGRRMRLFPRDRLFYNRDIDFEVLELTSRVSTNDVAEAKRRLSIPQGKKEDVDVALATNMISVGLDIVRLGLMVVLGQPKTSSEYIQASSRVGRDQNRPGLVVTLLNIHKPRDRSHYERFTAWHDSFYRNVEATSVTPFSPRALDRALAAALVALCRQSRSDMTPAKGAFRILQIRSELEQVAKIFAERAEHHSVDLQNDPMERQKLFDHVKQTCDQLLDAWMRIALKAQEEGSRVDYQIEDRTAPRRLLYEFLHPDIAGLTELQKKFRANRSMRDVEPAVEVFVRNLNDWEDR